MEKEWYSVEQAAKHALNWCKKHPAWMRICDLPFPTEELYYKWEELSKKEQEPWIEEYARSAKEAWEEFSYGKCKVEYGFISGRGDFYDDVLDVPPFHNLMMVFKVDKKKVSECQTGF
jgi:hypothetical protein